MCRDLASLGHRAASREFQNLRGLAETEAMRQQLEKRRVEVRLVVAKILTEGLPREGSTTLSTFEPRDSPRAALRAVGPVEVVES